MEKLEHPGENVQRRGDIPTLEDAFDMIVDKVNEIVDWINEHKRPKTIAEKIEYLRKFCHEGVSIYVDSFGRAKVNICSVDAKSVEGVEGIKGLESALDELLKTLEDSGHEGC